MDIITRFLYKIKLFYRRYTVELGISLIIILVGVSCFYLGKYSALDTSNIQKGVEILTDAELGQEGRIDQEKPSHSGPQATTSGQVVASKTGKRYYLPWCSAALRISDKNKVYFASAADAVKAGLTPASNCKGMK